MPYIPLRAIFTPAASISELARLYAALVALKVAYSVRLSTKVLGLSPGAHHLRGRRGLNQRVICGRTQFKVALISHFHIGNDQSLVGLVKHSLRVVPVLVIELDLLVPSLQRLVDEVLGLPLTDNLDLGPQLGQINVSL